MKQILISEFKTHCISLLKKAQRNGQGFVITIRGVPLASVEPISPGDQPARVLGASRDILVLPDDIVKTDTTGEWESLT